LDCSSAWTSAGLDVEAILGGGPSRCS
jgi:hypothetical protein